MNDDDLRPEPTHQQLPPALEAAIRQARSRQPAPESLAKLIEQASRFGNDATVAVIPKPSWVGRLVAVLTVVAASVVVWVITSHPSPAPNLPALVVTADEPQRTYSPVTQRSLVDAGFKQIEADLRNAELQLSQTTDAIALAELRREVRRTLEEYRLAQ